MPNHSPRVVVLSTAALLGAVLAAAGVSAQTGRVVTPAETVKAVQPSFPAESQPNEGSAASAPETPAGGDAEPAVASDMDVLKGKVAALETRVAALEEMLRKMGGGSDESGGDTAPTPGDPALAETSPTEEQIQQAKEQRMAASEQQRETKQEFDQMQDEQRQETQEQIRNRINNAQLDDNNNAGRGGY